MLAENNNVQTFIASQDPSRLIASYNRLIRLAKQLKRSNPDIKSYCLALTILAICAETELNQLRRYYEQARWDNPSRTQYILCFERLQYQINLASSLLS